MRATTLHVLLLLTLVPLAACEVDEDDAADGGSATDGEIAADAAPDPSPAITGNYVDDFDVRHAITDETWTVGRDDMASVFHIRTVYNGAMYLIAENDAANDFAEGLWSRFEWADVNGELWFCQAPFNAPTAEAAAAAERPDRSDPTAGGCAMFPWSKLHPVE